MKAIPWKNLVPVFVALGLFYALSLIYFSPALDGQQLKQHDRDMWYGMAQEVMEHREATDEDPLWTGSMFSGMPAYQISVLWPKNLLMWADDAFHGFLPRPASFLFLYLLGMYILMCCLRIDPWLAIVGAVAFGFSSYFFVILTAGHNSKANAIGYMPMVLGAVYLLYRGKQWLGASLLALFLGLEIAMNHVQVTYYLALMLALFVVAEAVRAFREKAIGDFVKRSGLGLAGVVLALSCNIGLLWTTYEYGQYSTRGRSELTIQPDGAPVDAIRTSGLDRDYVTQYSYGKQESLTLLVPNAKGGPSAQIGNDQSLLAKADPRFRQNLAQMSSYWGDQLSTAGPVYVGAIMILLMLLMLARTEGRGRWWMLGSLVLLALVVSITNAGGPDVMALSEVAGIRSSLLVGLLVLAYLVTGLVLVRDTLVFALFSSFLLCLMLAWGHNLMPLTDFFLDHVPGYSKFRAVTIIMVIVELAIPVLGILYLDRLVREGGWDKPTEKRFMVMAGVVLGALLVMAVAPESVTSFLSDRERDALNEQASDPAMEAQVVAFVNELKAVRVGIFTADVWRSFGFVLVGGLLLFLFGRKVVGRTVLLAGLGLLVLVDLWVVDKRYLHNDKDRGRYLMWEDAATAALPFTPNAADMAILESEWSPEAEADQKQAMDRLKQHKQQESGRNKVVSKNEELVTRFGSLRRHAQYRVMWLANPFNDARVSYFHRSVGGYHGAKLKRYQELIEFHLAPARSRVVELLQSGTSVPVMDSLMAREGVLNMLNVRYLIYSDERPPIRNTNALGDGWFVEELRWVKNADEEISTLGTIDPARTALVDERYKAELGDLQVRPDPSASVTLDSYRTNELSYTVRSANGGLAVFSEVWYGPDWTATLDGKEVPHVRADYVLRALAVPAGEHKVVFKVKGRAYDTSQPIAMAGSLLVLLLVLGSLWMELRPAKAEG